MNEDQRLLINAVDLIKLIEFIWINNDRGDWDLCPYCWEDKPNHDEFCKIKLFLEDYEHHK